MDYKNIKHHPLRVDATAAHLDETQNVQVSFVSGQDHYVYLLTPHEAIGLASQIQQLFGLPMPQPPHR